MTAFRVRALCVLLTGTFLTGAVTVQAQAASQPTDSAQPTQTGVQDIIVTATKRSENLQKVPTTVVAVSQADLKAHNIESILQLPSLVSGLAVFPQAGNSIFIRGLGAGGIGYAEAPGAAYLDGIYLANPAMNTTNFNDVQRVEVLKGPQGTLYGRNAVAGLIAVNTLDPTGKTKIDASAGYDNYQTVTLKAYASTGLTQNLSASVAGYYIDQGKGWTLNTFTGNRLQAVKGRGLHAKMVWQPSADTKVTGNFFYSFSNNTTGFGYQVAPGYVGTDGTTFLGQYKNNLRIDPSAPTNIYIGSIKIETDLHFARLVDLTAYQTSATHITTPFSNPTIGYPVAGQDVSFLGNIAGNKTFTQELQLTSENTQKLDWVAGLYYYDDDTKTENQTWNTCIATTCGPNVIPQDSTASVLTRSYSAYGDATYHLSPSTRLTGGLRYTYETKRLAGTDTVLAGYPDSVAVLPSTVVAYAGQPFAGYPNGIPTSLSFSQLTYRVVAAQDLGERIHAYASYSTGFKSGTFQPNSFTNPPVRPEHLYATEVGVKSELFDRMLRLNAAYFHYIYKDVQVSSTAPPALPGAPILQNAARLKYDGVDIDAVLAPARGLQINAGLELLNAHYADFPGTTCVTAATTVVNGVVVGNPVTAICNLAGRRPANAPPITGNIGISYEIHSPIGSFMAQVNDRYAKRYPLEPADVLYQNSYHLVDASITWKSPDAHYDLRVWGTNLAGEYIYAFGQINRNFLVVPQAPRTVGATLGVHF